MRIQDYEFEEEKTLTSLTELFQSITDQLEEGKKLELPMPSLKEGKLEVPLGEPIETDVEVSIRKHFVHLNLKLAWPREDILEE